MSNPIRGIGIFLLFAVFLNFTGCGLIVINYDKINGVDSTDDPKNSVTDDSVTNDITDGTMAPPPEVTQIDYAEIISDNLEDAPDKDYGGATFKIVTPDPTIFDPGSGLDFLSEAVSERNRLVGEKHSVSIITTVVEYDNLFNEVSTSVKAGMYFSDLLMLPQHEIGSFAASGLLLNLGMMAELDYSGDYLNKSSIEACAGGTEAYALAGYASLHPYSLSAVYFNKELCKAGGYDMYSLVRSGEWTWDKFFEVSSVSASVDGHFSWGTSLGDEVYDAVFFSGGHKMVNSGRLIQPTLGFDAESTVWITDVLKKLYADPAALRSSEEALSKFADGSGYFLIDSLSVMPNLSGSAAEWGILPLPKSPETDNYTTLSDKNSLMFTCPASVATPDKSAHILMSLNAASKDSLREAYISFFQYNYLRDNDSANMLEVILESAVYNFPYTYGTFHPDIANATYELIRECAMPDVDMGTLINQRKGRMDFVFSSKFSVPN